LAESHAPCAMRHAPTFQRRSGGNRQISQTLRTLGRPVSALKRNSRLEFVPQIQTISLSRPSHSQFTFLHHHINSITEPPINATLTLGCIKLCNLYANLINLGLITRPVLPSLFSLPFHIHVNCLTHIGVMFRIYDTQNVVLRPTTSGSIYVEADTTSHGTFHHSARGFQVCA
jgi:hypothetical protein